ncbi:Hypothetical protein D9617_9g023620 [Elsinoe fawcettii]|nr:Hypothetical protein D9617_9g023620 [Elsinoe fawcettii]
MEGLASSFTITVDGAPISQVGETADTKAPAKAGGEAATFTLKDGRLYSGDWVLGRATTENRSLLPKPVMWFKAGADVEKQVQPVTLRQNGDNHEISFANARLITEDGNVFASHSDDSESSFVKVDLK